MLWRESDVKYRHFCRQKNRDMPNISSNMNPMSDIRNKQLETKCAQKKKSTNFILCKALVNHKTINQKYYLDKKSALSSVFIYDKIIYLNQ